MDRKPWVFGLDGVTLVEESLTAGQHEQIFLLINASMMHGELDISPTHCPVCRTAIAVQAFRQSLPLDGAIVYVANVLASELVDAFGAAEEVT